MCVQASAVTPSSTPCIPNPKLRPRGQPKEVWRRKSWRHNSSLSGWYGTASRRSRGVLAFRSESQHIGAMPRSITIRDVPDDARDELAARAALTGRSLQEYLRSQLIELARRPDPEALLARIRHRKDRTGSTLPADAILGHRDADHR